MTARRHLVSFGLAVAGHGLVLLLLWQEAVEVQAPRPAVDTSPRLAFEVLAAAPEAAPPEVEAAPPELRPVVVAPSVREKAPPHPLAKLSAPGAESPAPVPSPPAPKHTDAAVRAESPATEAPPLKGPALGPRRAESWMGRVLLGLGPRLADETRERSLAPEHLPTDDERAAKIARVWAAVEKRPDAVTTNKRVLVEGIAGGYRYVDEETGEALPEPPEPAASAVPMFGDGGRQLAQGFTDEWHKRPPKKAPRDDLVPTEDGGFVYSASGYTAKIEPNGSVQFSENLFSVKFGETSDVSENLLPFQGRDFTSGSFDATDALMRLAGKDPYVTDKLRFLDETRSLRVEMRKEHRLEMVEQAFVQLRRTLDGTWNNWAKPEADRRLALFELWDECADDAAGTLARDFVETYIRAHLPAESALAFTDDELSRFNTVRKSSVTFDPYRAG